MPSLRPQHRRGNGAVGVTLMRSANQFNNARRRETDAQGKRRVDGEAGHTQRREANALAPRGTTRNVRTPHTGATGHVSREGGRNNRSILRVSGEQLEAACERTHETAAPPRTNGDSARNTSTAPIQSEGSVRTASTAPPHPKKIKTLKRST